MTPSSIYLNDSAAGSTADRIIRGTYIGLLHTAIFTVGKSQHFEISANIIQGSDISPLFYVVNAADYKIAVTGIVAISFAYDDSIEQCWQPTS